MSRQLQFDFGATSLGLRPPSRWPRQARSDADRLMFRLHPAQSAQMATVADHTRRSHGLSGKPRDAGQLHVSLVGLHNGGEIDRTTVHDASAAAATVRVPAFELAFDRIASFHNRESKPLVLLCGKGADKVVELERRIIDALNRAGLRLRRRAGLVPHCTVLYADRLVPETPLDRPIVVPITEFHLLHRSASGRRRSVGNWPLLG
ncbi:2'-5' RNA ligase [Aminobacter aminovorans]|uniref:2'-5' RNA ligase n=2 Tax=Aminobacter aminovorans TaxID=83263 RepID=A0A380WQN5_AMIAI|nr:2'-5' RNA ligase [Aminobacter aminovorans]SUU91267.1 2'-5' RNA ligase [Aminobacter aminovorans]